MTQKGSMVVKVTKLWLGIVVVLTGWMVGQATAGTPGMIAVANVGPQWRVDALFTQQSPSQLIGCQALSSAAPGVGEWSITETPDGRLHVAGGYLASPPAEERGDVRAQVSGANGEVLGGFDTVGAVGEGRFALIMAPGLGDRQMLRDATRLSIAGMGRLVTVELSMMRQLDAILRTCVRHYADTTRRHAAGSEKDTLELMQKIKPLLGAAHTVVSTQDGAAPETLTTLKGGAWTVEPWQDPGSGKVIGCAARRLDQDGRQWTFVTTPDLIMMVQIERPGIGVPLATEDGKRTEIEFRGIRQGGKFYRDTETASLRDPRIYGKGTVGKDFVRFALSFDTFAQSSFVRASTFRVSTGQGRYDMAVHEQDLALFGTFECLRESFTPDGAVWPARPSEEEMHAFVKKLVGGRERQIQTGKRLQSIEPAISFQWQDLIGHVSVFDPAHSKPIAERIAKSQDEVLNGCYKKRRNQVMEFTPPPGIDAALGVQMECDVQGFIEYRYEIVAVSGRVGAHLVLEAYAVHSASRDASSRMRRITGRAKTVLPDFVLHRSASAPVTSKPFIKPEPKAGPGPYQPQTNSMGIDPARAPSRTPAQPQPDAYLGEAPKTHSYEELEDLSGWGEDD